jgi:hypothetical protein
MYHVHRRFQPHVNALATVLEQQAQPAAAASDPHRRASALRSILRAITSLGEMQTISLGYPASDAWRDEPPD